MTPNAGKRGKFGSLGAIFLFIFLPCMWGLGLQKESPELSGCPQEYRTRAEKRGKNEEKTKKKRRKSEEKMMKKRRKTKKNGKIPSDPIYTNPTKNLPILTWGSRGVAPKLILSLLRFGVLTSAGGDAQEGGGVQESSLPARTRQRSREEDPGGHWSRGGNQGCWSCHISVHPCPTPSQQKRKGTQGKKRLVNILGSNYYRTFFEQNTMFFF